MDVLAILAFHILIGSSESPYTQICKPTIVPEVVPYNHGSGFWDILWSSSCQRTSRLAPPGKSHGQWTSNSAALSKILDLWIGSILVDRELPSRCHLEASAALQALPPHTPLTGALRSATKVVAAKLRMLSAAARPRMPVAAVEAAPSRVFFARRSMSMFFGATQRSVQELSRDGQAAQSQGVVRPGPRAPKTVMVRFFSVSPVRVRFVFPCGFGLPRYSRL